MLAELLEKREETVARWCLTSLRQRGLFHTKHFGWESSFRGGEWCDSIQKKSYCAMRNAIHYLSHGLSESISGYHRNRCRSGRVVIDMFIDLVLSRKFSYHAQNNCVSRSHSNHYIELICKSEARTQSTVERLHKHVTFTWDRKSVKRCTRGAVKM